MILSARRHQIIVLLSSAEDQLRADQKISDSPGNVNEEPVEPEPIRIQQVAGWFPAVQIRT